jgi:hypothetical protein
MRYFLGVGAQKAGTTWLHEQLKLHPEVAVPQQKEVHYFDTMYPTRSGHSFGAWISRALGAAVADGNTRRAVRLADLLEVFFRGPEAYRQYLDSNCTEHTKVAGEITPAYAGLTHAGFAAVKEALDPLILFSMRDPLERYWSQVKMLGGDDPARLVKAFQTRFRRPATWSRCDYPALLKTLDDVFPQEQVLTLFYENMFDEAVLSDIGRFLEVQPSWSWHIDKHARAGVALPMPDPTPEMLERFEPVYRFVRERFGTAVPDSWRL